MRASRNYCIVPIKCYLQLKAASCARSWDLFNSDTY